MPTTKAIFNSSGRWYWFFGDDDVVLDLHLEPCDLLDTWYVADLPHHEDLNYDTSVHIKQIQRLLSKPSELILFVPSDKLKASIMGCQNL